MQNELKSAIHFNDFVAYFGAREYSLWLGGWGRTCRPYPPGTK